jgi:hypothetical protein
VLWWSSVRYVARLKYAFWSRRLFTGVVRQVIAPVILSLRAFTDTFQSTRTRSQAGTSEAEVKGKCASWVKMIWLSARAMRTWHVAFASCCDVLK